MPATYDSLARTTLGSDQNSITFSGIPSSYTDLRLVLVTVLSGSTAIFLQVNSDTGNNYRTLTMSGHGNFGVTSSNISNTNYMDFSLGTSEAPGTLFPTLYTVDIFSYAGSTRKSILTTSTVCKNSNFSSTQTAIQEWSSLSAINSITFGNAGGGVNYKAGTVASLYGILRA